MEGGFCINDWLINEGYLALKEPVSSPTKLTLDKIDWTHTQAWGEGGYYSRIFINVRGREPTGVVGSSGIESFRENLKKRLEEVLDESVRLSLNSQNQPFKGFDPL